MGGVRVGIPRALLYFRYSSVWRELFVSLGAEVVVSPPTNPGIMRAGLRHSYSDFCLPVKAALGHIESLSGSVDFLFVPRYISLEEDSYMCPKFLGLPDVVRASFPRLPTLLCPPFNMKEGSEKAVGEFVKSMAMTMGLGQRRVMEAYGRAFSGDRSKPGRPDMPPSGEGPNIAVLGRPYLVFDDHLSGGVLKTLGRLGVNPVYREPSTPDVERAMDGLIKRVYWGLGKEVVAQADMYFSDPQVDGIIHLSNATCGPDAFLGEVIKGIREGWKKPYMSISIDEHTSDVGMQTRIEAFVDMMSVRAAGA